MFKLVVLSTLLTVVLARPGLHESTVYSAPAYASFAVHEPALAHVGSIVKSVPSAISHHSQSVVHSSSHAIEDVYVPAVKSTSYTTKSLVAPVVESYVVPTYFKTVANPVIYKTYASSAPVFYKSW